MLATSKNDESDKRGFLSAKSTTKEECCHKTWFLVLNPNWLERISAHCTIEAV